MGVPTQRWRESLQSPTGLRWMSWLGIAAITLLSGVVLLPAVRRYPEGLHAHFASAPLATRSVACFLIALGIVAILFRLLSPRWAHLRKDIRWKYPPCWSAVALAAVALCGVDLVIGLGPDQFQATVWEWLGYAGGSVAIVGSYRWITTRSDPPVPPPAPSETVEELVRDWPRLERCLRMEVAAEDDLLGTRSIACRLADYLSATGGTVGIVGPFGSGKSSIVKWLTEEVDRRNRHPGHRIWMCEVNCWGFEDSASAIQQILSCAVQAIELHADCFSIRHLPESYRKTFSAGGDWVRSLADLVLGTADPLEQFRSLSEVLKLLDARLVIVVEDLDRTSSTRFDRQEVLALLNRVKMADRMSFVLTGGQPLSRTNPDNRIDFSRLCDRIELLPAFELRQVALILRAVRDRCLGAYPDDVSMHPTEDPWRDFSLFTVWFDALTEVGALAQLLRTPRVFKHALRRTYQAWERLHGEVDFDHLLAVNVLREGAPEALDYVFRNWEHLRRDPRDREDFGQRNRFAERLRREWADLIATTDWDARAAETLFRFILPNAAEYFRDGERQARPGNRRVQGITERDGRYWRRVLNGEIACNEIRDQVVLRDMDRWLRDRNPSGPLVDGMVGQEEYAGAWEHLSCGWDGELLLCLSDHVLARYRDNLGTRREVNHIPNFPPFAFGVVWRQANRRVRQDDTSLAWLEEHIRRAVPRSLMLLVDLYYYWASPRNGIIQQQDRGRVRRLMLQLAREQCRTLESLLEVTHPGLSDLHGLVYPWSDNEPPHVASEYCGAEHWGWLGPVLLEGLRSGLPVIALKIARLIAEPRRDVHPGVEAYEARRDRLHGFFGADAPEVIRLLETARDRFAGHDRVLLDQVVASAQSAPPDSPAA